MADNELKISAPGPFPPFQHASSRDRKDSPNIWFFVLNAAWKFDHHDYTYGLGGLSQRARLLIEKTLRVVELLYYRPIQSKRVRKLSDSAVGAGDGRQSYSVSNTSTAKPKLENASSSLANNDVQGGGDGMRDDSEASDSDTSVGLTNEEVDEVFRKLEDPTLSGMDRFRLSSLLLFPKRELAHFHTKVRYTHINL